jgi:hypothetical protein
MPVAKRENDMAISERKLAMRDHVTPAERLGEDIAAECYLRINRARAIGWLGMRWRGQHLCTHRYVDSHGVDTSITMRRSEHE